MRKDNVTGTKRRQRTIETGYAKKSCRRLYNKVSRSSKFNKVSPRTSKACGPGRAPYCDRQGSETPKRGIERHSLRHLSHRGRRKKGPASGHVTFGGHSQHAGSG